MLVRGLIVVGIIAIVCWTTLGQDIGLAPIILPPSPTVPAKHIARKIADPMEPNVRLREALAEPVTPIAAPQPVPVVAPLPAVMPPPVVLPPPVLPDRILDRIPEKVEPVLVPPTPINSPIDPFPGTGPLPLVFPKAAPAPVPIQIPPTPAPTFPPVVRQPTPSIIPVQVSNPPLQQPVPMPAPAPVPVPTSVVIAPTAKPIAVTLRGRVVSDLGTSVALLEIEGRIHTVVRDSVIPVVGGSIKVNELTASDVVLQLQPSREFLRLR